MSFFGAIKICIKAHYLQAVLLCDDILVGIIKIQMEPFRDFCQSKSLLRIYMPYYRFSGLYYYVLHEANCCKKKSSYEWQHQIAHRL